MVRSKPEPEDPSPSSSEFEEVGIDEAHSMANSATDSDWQEGEEQAQRSSEAGGSNKGGKRVSMPSTASPVEAASPTAEGVLLPAAEQGRGAPGGGAGLVAKIEEAEAAPLSPTDMSREPGEEDDQEAAVAAVEDDGVQGAAAYDPLREIEEATSKVAELARNAASDVSQKLFGGGSGSGTDYSLAKLTSGLSSFWANIDPVQKPVQTEESALARAGTESSKEAQALFELAEDEELLDSFRCTLVQTCSCEHNTFTPPSEELYPGMLYITDQHTCFKGDKGGVTFTIAHSSIVHAEKMLPTKKGDAGTLRLEFEEEQFVMLRSFMPEAAKLDSALALIEHVTGD